MQQPVQNYEVPPYKNPPFYTTAAFAVLTASVVMVLFIIGVIIILFLSRLPSVATETAIGVIISIAGPLIAALVLIVRQQFNVDLAVHTAQLVNGHLDMSIQEAQQKTTAQPPPAPGS